MTATGPSEELQAQINNLLDDQYAQFVDAIAAGRNLSADAVRAAIDQAPLTAEEAQKQQLVDVLVTRGLWKTAIETELNAPTDPTWISDYAAPSTDEVDLSDPFEILKLLFSSPKSRRVKDPTIAIIHADGTIVDGASSTSLLGGRTVGDRTLEQAFTKAAETPEIRAVVFRIDSPGGSAMASEMIYQAVKRCAAIKPVIVSIGTVGASGGYYIAVPGQTIYADAPAIVGSIGVVAGKLATDGLLEKLHLQTWRTTRGANAGMLQGRPWTPDELATIRKHATKTYEVFLDRVQTHRGEKVQNIDDVAQGRIFTARQAKKLGLVDEIGGLAAAVEAARNATGLTGTIHYQILPRPQTLREVLTGQEEDVRTPLRSQADAAAIRTLLDQAGWTGRQPLQALSHLLTLAELLGQERVLMAQPFSLQVSP